MIYGLSYYSTLNAVPFLLFSLSLFFFFQSLEILVAIWNKKSELAVPRTSNAFNFLFFFFFSLTAQFVGSSESVGDPMTQKKRQRTGGTEGISKVCPNQCVMY